MGNIGPGERFLHVHGAGRAARIDADAGLALTGWRLSKDGAIQRYYGHNGQRKWVILKRAILGILPGDKRVVINVNGDKFDCRRCNLLAVDGTKISNEPVLRRYAIEAAGAGC